MLINKKQFLSLVVLVGAFLPVAALKADDTTGIPVLIDVGNVTNSYVSYLVIDDTSLGNSAFEYAWHYSSLTETDGVTPLTGDDLLNAVMAGTSNAPYALTQIADPSFGTSFTDGFQVGNQTSTIISSQDFTATNAWEYWFKGGSLTLSYPPYTTYTPSNWLSAADTSLARTITNGSYDGWTVSGFDTNFNYTGLAPLAISAVPEPNTAPLLLLSLLSLLLIFRWKTPASLPKQ